MSSGHTKTRIAADGADEPDGGGHLRRSGLSALSAAIV